MYEIINTPFGVKHEPFLSLKAARDFIKDTNLVIKYSKDAKDFYDIAKNLTEEIINE